MLAAHPDMGEGLGKHLEIVLRLDGQVLLHRRVAVRLDVDGDDGLGRGLKGAHQGQQQGLHPGLVLPDLQPGTPLSTAVYPSQVSKHSNDVYSAGREWYKQSSLITPPFGVVCQCLKI